MTDSVSSRRQALRTSFAAGLGIATFGATQARAADAPTFLPKGAKTLEGLHHALEKAPRRRDFKAVPMILEHKDQWDSEALDLLRHYAGGPRQVWNNTNLEGPWLNLMRNAMNAQIWSFGHPDFLAVSATHGSAHLALFDAAMWDKYKFAALTQGKAKSNTWMDIPAAASADAKDIEDPKGVYSPGDNSIPVLQRRGAVFMACHNAIWEISGKLIAKGVNPDKLSHEAIASELTNHLVPGVVLTPGIVATLPELQDVGYRYAG